MTEVAERAPAAPAPTPARGSALAELLRYRQLVAVLVVRELKVRYKRSVLGLLWTMLNPLLLMVVYTVVFATIMRSPQRNFAIFLLSGLLLGGELASVAARAFRRDAGFDEFRAQRLYLIPRGTTNVIRLDHGP